MRHGARNVAGDNNHAGQQERDTAKGQQICSLDTVEHAGQDARNREGGRQSQAETDEDQPQTLPDEDAQYIAGLGAERNANADLMRAPFHR